MNNLGLNMAATIAADSFNVGGNWGFLSENNRDFDKILSILRSDNTIKMYSVSNGYIIFVNPNYLSSVISQVEVVTPEVWSRQQTRVSTEVTELQRYLTNILRKSVRPTQVNPEYEEYTFAIYSCNTLHKLRLNGIEYPAFSLSEKEVIKELAKLRNYVEIYFSVESGFKYIGELSGSAGIEEVVKGWEISDTITGVFMTIRIVRK